MFQLSADSSERQRASPGMRSKPLDWLTQARIVGGAGGLGSAVANATPPTAATPTAQQRARAPARVSLDLIGVSPPD
jgi:hypothetical protein